MAQRLTVHRDGEAIYDIVMEPDFNGLGPEVEKLGLSERKICLVTDSNVATLYLDAVSYTHLTLPTTRQRFCPNAAKRFSPSYFRRERSTRIWIRCAVCTSI